MQKECEYCGNLFSGQRTNRKYCSDNCKQMAYYKRNGLVLANFSGYDSSALPEKENGSAKTVKHDSVTEINDALLNAIADRLLILLEERLAKRIACGGITIENMNVKDTVNVKPYFTENDTQNSPTCNSQLYQGISYQRTSDDVRVPAIVKHDSAITTQPAVKRDEITVKHTRKRKNKYQPLASVPLQNERSEHLSETKTNERQFEELELTLRNFTVSDETALPDESLASGNETPVNKELSTPLENQPVDCSSTNSKMIVQEKKPESVKYEWVDSPFINQIEDFISNDFTDLSNYRHKKQYIKVLECFKCLIWTLVQFSNRPKIDPDTFFKVATAFSYLTQSSAFSEVPANYPYYSLIVEMKEKICAVAESQRVSAFRISPKRKAMLIAIRYQMGGHIKDLKFSDLFVKH